MLEAICRATSASYAGMHNLQILQSKKLQAHIVQTIRALSWLEASQFYLTFFMVTSLAPGRSYDCQWWRHQMGLFSALLALYEGNSPVLVNSLHNGQWRGALMFSLICVWINDWVNNREAGDLRRHRGHYDVNVMPSSSEATLKNIVK